MVLKSAECSAQPLPSLKTFLTFAINAQRSLLSIVTWFTDVSGDLAGCEAAV